MKRKLRYFLGAVAVFAVGVTGARDYARLAAPYYSATASLIAQLHPWKVVDVSLARDESSHGVVLQLTGEVRLNRHEPGPAAIVVSRVQTGEVVESPVVFWTMLLLWPAGTMRARLVRLGLGIPVFLTLEWATTTCQLVHSMAEASSILTGTSVPCVWELWSRFLEGGGRFAVEIVAALIAIAASRERVLTAPGQSGAHTPIHA